MNVSAIRNGYDHLAYLTEVMARRFALRLPRRVVISVAVVLVLACVAAGVVAVRSGWFGKEPSSAKENAISAVVGTDGLDVTLSGVHLSGPAGLAPAGTVVTATPTTSSPPELPTAITTNLGAGVDISLQGRQPDKPLEVRFPVVGTPPEGQHAVLVTVPSDGSGAHLVPASFDAGTGTITATTNHLSLFWPAFIDLREVGRTFDKFVTQTLGITSPRPDCAGEKVTDPSGTTISPVGDYSPTAKPAAWPCVSTKDGQVVVELTSNSPLPWRTRATPAATLDPQGTPDLAKAAILAGYHTLVTERPYAEGLLIPGTTMSYRFPAGSSTATVQGQVDLGTWLAMDLVFAVQSLMALFHVDYQDVGTNADRLTCLGDAVEAAQLGAKPGVDAVTNLARAVLSCLAPLAGDALKDAAAFVLLVLSSGISLVVGGFLGAALTATSADTFRIDVESTGKPITAADLSTAPVPGMCQHPAGTLVDGSLPGIPTHDGFVQLVAKGSPSEVDNPIVVGDLTADGTPDAAAVFMCSRGGVGWPHHVVLYGPGPEVLGSVDLGSVTDGEHSNVRNMSIEGGDVALEWNSYQGASFCLRGWSARIHWTGSQASVTGLVQTSGPAKGTC
ncbi:hypothetical protein CLV43_108250 [Umezawaea tangerina]|uniref:Uncharacterized protein n=1 Tax=Umezawaea tangerina TaxID=84725 RepID=A0A2T0SZL2_9PSEU|nr:hypothetical protein CLV43_108250 [Umezawaea tangerina]